MIKEYSVSGTALTGEDLEARDVTIVVADGIITAVEEEKTVPPNWICPAFFNAHTHLADTVAMDLPCCGTLAELVTPPYGLKHQILAQTSQNYLISAMKDSIREMIHSGTAGFADFREGGPEGVAALKQAAAGMPIRPIILGRDGGEELGNGVGISSARDVCGISDIVEQMKKAGKIVGIHAGERDPQDIDAALDAKPDFLVHCTHATDLQVKRISEERIPVVICCRSNFLLQVSCGSHHPPVRKMLDADVQVLIGTDNVMFVQPDMMQEMAFVHTVYGVPAHQLLLCGVGGFPPAGISHAIKKGNKASFNVFDTSWGNIKYSRDIESTIVKRGPSSHFCARIF